MNKQALLQVFYLYFVLILTKSVNAKEEVLKR